MRKPTFIILIILNSIVLIGSILNIILISIRISKRNKTTKENTTQEITTKEKEKELEIWISWHEDTVSIDDKITDYYFYKENDEICWVFNYNGKVIEGKGILFSNVIEHAYVEYYSAPIKQSDIKFYCTFDDYKIIMNTIK